MKFKQHKLLRIAFTVISIVFIAYVVGEFGGGNILKTLKHINPVLATSAFFLFALTLLAKTMRFRFILKNKISIKNLLSIVSVHSFWNNILPFKSGEMAYLYMVNKEKNISRGENVVSLILARVFDLLIVLSFFSISGFFIFHQHSNFVGPVPLVLVISILISSVAVLWGVIFHRHRLNNFFSNPHFNNEFFKKIFRILAETSLALDQIRNLGRLAIFFTLSLSVWVFDTLFVWMSLSAGGLDLSLAEATFIGIFPALASLVPINFVGNLGVFEGTITGGLVLLGIGGERAFDLSFILHTQLIVFSFLLFVLAFWYRNMFSQEIPDAQAKTHTEFYSTLISPGKDFRNKNLTDFVLGMIKRGNLLDIGSGLGLLVSRANKKSIPAKGIEPDKKLVDLSEKFFGKLDIVHTPLETYDTNEKFDNVVMIDVLECIDDYKKALGKAISLLRDGGRLVVVIPAYTSFFGSRDRMMGYFRRFDKNKFSLELNALSLRILKTRYWNMFGVVPYWVLYKVLERQSHFENMRGGGGRRGVLSAILDWCFKYIENNVNFGFGLSLVFVAEKKSN